MNPEVVGVDIRFPMPKDNKSDSLLIDAISRNSSKLVLAKAFHGDSYMPSIIGDEQTCFGITNQYDFYRYSPFIEFNGQIDTLFSYQIAKKANPKLDLNNRFIINYSNLSFRPYNAVKVLNNPANLEKQINGKIVLVGDVDNSKDYHKIPFIIRGSEWISGIYLHAYATYSLINSGFALEGLPIWLNVILCWALSFFFSFAFVWLNDKVTFSEEKLKYLYPLFLFFRPFIFLIVNFLLLVICFYLFTVPFRIVPDVVLYSIAILLLNFFYDHVSHIINKKKSHE